MYEYKLQAIAILIVFYFIIIYFKATHDAKLKTNKLYVALLVAAPLGIFFDGATAWTVNRMDTIPEWVNMSLHLCFYLSMDALIIIIFLYTMSQTIGYISRKRFALLTIPGIIATIGILYFMKDTYFVHGSSTWYSLGPSVIVCYGSLMFHEVLIAISFIHHWRYIERRILVNVIGFYSIFLLFIIIQMIIPESLISSALPMIGVIGAYICFEDPSIKKMKDYNEKMVTAFATLVESRDDSTGNHIKRTTGYVRIILREMLKKTEYHDVLTSDYIHSVLKAAPMHDIGKMSTPDSILKKPGKLTEEEFDTMRRHTIVGGEIIKEVFSEVDSPESIRIAYEVARYHHEKWNGAGYPEGLKGEEIPLHARIMSIADVFDAVSEDRCYRAAMPLETCFKLIEDGAGTDFDPRLVELFLNAKKEVLAYHESTK